jgi:hypothetical protein
MLPSSLVSTLGQASTVGFSGSRSLVPSVASSVFERIGSAQVLVGDARGVDAAVRRFFPNPVVFQASPALGRGATAERSIRFVRWLAACEGVLVSFPSAGCPPSLVPSDKPNKCFCGLGSGTWATLALAVGLGVPCYLFAPFGGPAGWGFASLGAGWFVSVPQSAQASLF